MLAVLLVGQTPVTIAEGVRVLEVADPVAFFRYLREPARSTSQIVRYGVIWEVNRNYVRITWDGVPAITMMHSWWELTHWQRRIVAYHDNGTNIFINALTKGV